MTIKLGRYSSSELSNSDYHALRNFYSSSQFKTAVEDIELFYKKYISQELIDDKEIPAFDIGTYYHTAILEPENLDKECSVFRGKIRRGKEWDKFKEENKDKAIITESEFLQAQNLIDATRNSPRAMELLLGGESEVSVFTTLHGLPVKARADYVNLAEGYILDLKSTTGNSKDSFKTKNKISSYDYDLSAALYIDAFNAHFGPGTIHTFYWVFASKDYCNCKVYRSTDEILAVGRAKYQKGLHDILRFQALNWDFPDEIADLEPLPWEKEIWLGGKSEEKKYNNYKPGNRPSTDGDLL